MLRTTLLAASRSPRSRKLIEQLPPTRAIVDRFVAGETLDQGVAVTDRLIATGRRITLDHLGEDTADATQAAATAEAYEHLLAALGETGLADRAEVSVKLSAVGQFLPEEGEKVALENARRICAAAAAVGTTV
ncbi:proline dehydrogenase, partial [Streptacidiphilus sp. MAP12-20]